MDTIRGTAPGTIKLEPSCKFSTSVDTGINGETVSPMGDRTSIRLIVVGFVPEGVGTIRGTMVSEGVTSWAHAEKGKSRHDATGGGRVPGTRGLGSADVAVASSDPGTADDIGWSSTLGYSHIENTSETGG